MKTVALILLAFSVLLLGCVQAPAGTASPTVVVVGGTAAPTVAPAGTMNPEAGAVAGAGGASVKEFAVSITHFGGYDPDRFEASAGDTVRFTVTSDPLNHEHGMTIDALGVDVEVTQTPQVIEFVASQAGEFPIYCKSCDNGPVGAHPWMTGTLVVR